MGDGNVGQKPRAGTASTTNATVHKAHAPPKASASANATKPAAKSSEYKEAARKPLSITGRLPAHKPPAAADPELQASAKASLRAAHSGTVAKPGSKPAPRLDPEVTSALKRVELNGYRSDKAQLVGEQMEKLTPDQQKELYANLPRNIRVQIDHDMSEGKIVPAGLSLARVGSMSDAKLAETATLMRGGVIEDLGLQVAVATELAARTKWGKANPDIIEHQKQMITDGKVNFADGRGAARTEKSGEIELDPGLAKSPEGMAATLAHEATHSFNATHGGMSASVYEEETAGNLAGTQVFAEIGDPNDTGMSQNVRDGLNDSVAQYKKFPKGGVQARVAAEYASEAGNAFAAAEERKAGSGRRSDKAKVRDVVNHLAADPAAQKAMSADYAYEVVMALLHTGANESELAKAGQALKGMPGPEQAAALVQLKAIDPDALKVLTAAMKG